jgi:hypothetical protein
LSPEAGYYEYLQFKTTTRGFRRRPCLPLPALCDPIVNAEPLKMMQARRYYRAMALGPGIIISTLPQITGLELSYCDTLIQNAIIVQ